MRHMTGHLAYALTGGLYCNQVRKRSLISLDGNLGKELFIDRFFGDDGSEVLAQAQQLFAVRKIREMGLGTVLDANFERQTWLKGSNDVNEDGSFHNRVRRIIMDDPDNSINRRRMRRYAYFFAQFEDSQEEERFISTFLRSESISKYVQFCGGNKDLSPRNESFYRNQILHVLQEFFTGLRFPEGSFREHSIYITLNREASASTTQMVLADFKVDDFKLVVKPRYKIGDSFSGVLCLKYLNGYAELDLDLPFLDYVARRYEGEVAEELSAFYADRLERFKVKLLSLYEKERGQYNENNLRLLVLGKSRSIDFKKLIIDDGKLEVV